MYSFHESKITQVSEAKQHRILELRPVHEKKQWFCLLCPVCICKTFRHFTHHTLQSASYSKKLILFHCCNWLFLVTACFIQVSCWLTFLLGTNQSSVPTHCHHSRLHVSRHLTADALLNVFATHLLVLMKHCERHHVQTLLTICTNLVWCII